MISTNGRIAALDVLEATLLITKHLELLCPFLMALQRVPVDDLRRLPLVQGLAGAIANDADAVQDWYKALSLMCDEDISARSVADLIELSMEKLHPNNPQVGEIWRVAYALGILDEETMGRWVILEQIGKVQ